ncbi:hypothetical protein DFQ14_112160 [Halopolyspora algeriensis]|uniref:PE family protein n=1 Tax=Halopolyspora algeriensis TaxID=1500506 RepID=A0A368VGA1_9ACTN|nr:hypothetical protein [Halopolyspora algeriensis]RCW40278.1 hypothetical protein DFQ14_112160 [Halopolyspora algeriensis]TQM46241.1 hypothetical protein FHU43_3911 [Halopolyspora algeriensis]
MTQPGDGFEVDVPALRAAVAELKDERDRIDQLAMEAMRGIKPGELVADDRTTQLARERIEARAVGEDGSLTEATSNLRDRLNEKIAAYEATIAEYQRRDGEALPNRLPGDARA